MAAAIQTLTERLEAITTEMAQLTAQNQQLVKTMAAQNSQLVSEVQILKTASNGGSVYTRWGRTTCTQNGSELIYTGYIGGNWLNKNGAADYICLSV
ncbi:hypothetical protein DPMN_135928 [Dreissena polymorpha]|uniref:Uncharacterized protein n=1 Tax=Dreissena polymorpha TaxID=45954 RepID=A0A9D4G2Q4_DREPO|nr:hypothetical protein DPMN_135928 [Dreissena polymorpha]